MSSLIYPGGDQQVTPKLGLATWGMDEVLAENMILIDDFASSSGTVPGGLTGSIQYNNNGVFGGSATDINAAGFITFPGSAWNNSGIVTFNDDDGIVGWLMSGGSFANSVGTRRNQVMRLGWNVGNGGVNVNPLETSSAVEWEDYYIGDFGSSDPAMEMHLAFYDLSGNAYRWQSADFDRVAYTTNISSEGDNWVWLRRSDGANLVQIVASGPQIDYNQSMNLFGFSSLSGTVTTNGTAVTWVSGNKFVPNMNGETININGVAYSIASGGVTSTTTLTLTTSAGVQGTPVPYTGTGNTWEIAGGSGIGVFADHVVIGANGYAPSSTGLMISGLSTQSVNPLAVTNENGVIFSLSPTGGATFTNTINTSSTMNFNGGATLTINDNDLSMGNAYFFRWNTAGADTSLSRVAAGIIGIGSGASASIAGSLRCASIALNGAVAAPVAGVYYSGGTAGVSAGPFSAITSIQTIGGIVTTLADVSDERLKNVSLYKVGLDILSKIEPIRFKYNAKGQDVTGFSADRDFIGFSAQNVQKAIPEAVVQSATHPDYLSFDDRPVIAVLVNAVKELKAELEILKASR